MTFTLYKTKCNLKLPRRNFGMAFFSADMILKVFCTFGIVDKPVVYIMCFQLSSKLYCDDKPNKWCNSDDTKSDDTVSYL